MNISALAEAVLLSAPSTTLILKVLRQNVQTPASPHLTMQELPHLSLALHKDLEVVPDKEFEAVGQLVVVLTTLHILNCGEKEVVRLDAWVTVGEDEPQGVGKTLELTNFTTLSSPVELHFALDSTIEENSYLSLNISNLNCGAQKLIGSMVVDLNCLEEKENTFELQSKMKHEESPELSELRKRTDTRAKEFVTNQLQTAVGR